MKKKNLKKIKLEQLSENTFPIPINSNGVRLKNIRQSLGLTQKQVASMLNIPRPAVSRIERNAQASSLKTLAKIANALHCEFMGAIVSKESFQSIIERQAYKKASLILKQTYANMAMEKQAPSKNTYEKRLKELTEELASNPNSSLWED